MKNGREKDRPGGSRASEWHRKNPRGDSARFNICDHFRGLYDTKGQDSWAFSALDDTRLIVVREVHPATGASRSKDESHSGWPDPDSRRLE